MNHDLKPDSLYIRRFGYYLEFFPLQILFVHSYLALLPVKKLNVQVVETLNSR